jgi:hypothetical protein
MRQVIKEAINQQVLEYVKNKYLDKENTLTMTANDKTTVKIAVVITEIGETGYEDYLDMYFRLTGISSATAELNSRVMQDAVAKHFKCYFNLDVDAHWLFPKDFKKEIRLLN